MSSGHPFLRVLNSYAQSIHFCQTSSKEDKELRKITGIALAALVAASMASAVSADDIVLKTSIGR